MTTPTRASFILLKPGDVYVCTDSGKGGNKRALLCPQVSQSSINQYTSVKEKKKKKKAY